MTEQQRTGAVEDFDKEGGHNAHAAREYQESVRRFIERPAEMKTAPKEKFERQGASAAH